MSYSERNRNTRNRPTERIGRSAGWSQNRDFRDQTKITPSKPVIFQTRTQSELNSQTKHLFEEFVNPDVIVSQTYSSRIHPIEAQQTLLDNQSHKGIKLITVTPIYITALHLIMQENQFFGIHKHRFCFYDFGVKEFVGTIDREKYTEAAERVIPQLEKRAPWLFEEPDELRREDPIVLLSKTQDFNTAFLMFNLRDIFSHDVQTKFDDCLHATDLKEANVIRFVERNAERLFHNNANPRLYHDVLAATIADGQNRLILSQIESSLAVRLLQHNSQKCFVANESIFCKSFAKTTLRDIFRALPSKVAHVKFIHGTFRKRDNKAVVGNKRGYNTDVAEVYEEYYTKLIEELFPTKLDCVTKMNQVIDADLRYSRFPGLILYMVSHGLSMLEQRYFGRRLQNSQVHFEVPARRRDKSPTSSYSKSSRRSRSSSRSSSSSRSGSLSRSRSYSRSSSPASRHDSNSQERLSTRRLVDNDSRHVLSTADQSPKRSVSLNEQLPTTNQSHNFVPEEERTNRFDRALLREQVDGISPLHSRSNSLVITEITYTENQPVHVESQPTVVQQNSTNQIAQKRQREESSNESGLKRRKTENFALDTGISESNRFVTQEKQGYAPVNTNAEPPLNGETTTNDELLELLASWQ